MQNKITRLLYELNALDKGVICLKDMANELGISLRTIQRDMNEIQEADFPLYCPEPGTYAFMEGFSLEKVQISDKEASMFVIMNEIANNLGATFGESFALLKKKLLSKQNAAPFFVKVNSGEDYPNSDIANTLLECINAKEKATICYSGGKRACYTVKPLKILWISGFWYLLSIIGATKIIKFRLNQITSITPTGKFFEIDTNIDEIIRQGTNIWFDEKRNIDVVLEISKRVAKYFKSKDYFPLQKIDEELPNGNIKVSCKATKLEEIIPTILNWLPDIKIYKPIELKQKIFESIKIFTDNNS